MKRIFHKLALVTLFLALGAILSGCRGAPCGNCGYTGGGYPGNYNYGQQYAAPGTVPQGTVIQPGYQYPPGSVPVAPQQLPPGAIYGG